MLHGHMHRHPHRTGQTYSTLKDWCTFHLSNATAQRASEAKVSIGASVPDVRISECARCARLRNAIAGFRLHRHIRKTSGLDGVPPSPWLSLLLRRTEKPGATG